MSKYANTSLRSVQRSPLRTVGSLGDTYTHEGAPAYKMDTRTELFTLAVSNMGSEDKFYETAAQSDSRFASLIHQLVASGDAGFVARMIPWLRGPDANMRSAPLIAACEYVRGMYLAGYPVTTDSTAEVVASAMQRADEPAEAIGYWLSRYGRPLPKSLLKGVALGAQRLFNEYSALKYDGVGRPIRMGDVLELAHPEPKNAPQSDLFKYLLDRRHNPTSVEIPESLAKIRANAALESLDVNARRSMLSEPGTLEAAGFTWERLSGWLPDGMDAEAWEAIIPNMGYMALLRNLRNFEQAGISSATKAKILARLADPDEVAKSRQLPFRFYSAWENTGSMTWASSLELALELSTKNVPVLEGRSLVLIDISGSMHQPLSKKSSVNLYTVGALFAGALASKNLAGTDLVVYGTNSKAVAAKPSVLKTIDVVKGEYSHNTVGHGTNTFAAINNHYNGHDRVVIFTDAQSHDSSLKVEVPVIHNFILGAYASTNFKAGENGRFQYGGFSDATFRMMKNIETAGHTDWPF